MVYISHWKQKQQQKALNSLQSCLLSPLNLENWYLNIRPFSSMLWFRILNFKETSSEFSLGCFISLLKTIAIRNPENVCRLSTCRLVFLISFFENSFFFFFPCGYTYNRNNKLPKCGFQLSGILVVSFVILALSNPVCL